jgi:UDP-2,4-diacetamido-2,4,6-trideoxy-beta-L-altropyranose hydrolase
MAEASLRKTLCFRVDASATMGIGHLMRCLALAQAWQDEGGKVVMVAQIQAAGVLGRLAAEGMEVHELQSPPASLDDAAETDRIAREAGAAWLVLDGYHFSNPYLGAVRANGLKLMVLDDLADADLFEADIVLNQNVYATAGMYGTRAPQAALLLGSTYALLRRDFLRGRPGVRTHRTVGREVLVVFGGGDAGNITQRAMEWLATMDGPRHRFTMVVGVANPHLNSLKALLSRVCARHDFELAVNPPNLPELMNRADLAVSAAGSTCWELACLGVPTVLIVAAPNQQRIADHMHEAGAAVSLGLAAEAFSGHGLIRIRELLAGATERERLGQTARRLVDGLGGRRVTEAVLAYPLRLRRAGMEDAESLWRWANDPVTRQASYKIDPIPWEAHQAWLQRLLSSPVSDVVFIATDPANEGVGTVRFRKTGQEGEISLSLAPPMRGKGLGSKLIRLAAFRVLDEGFCREVRGWVKVSNAASVGAFRRAGFLENGRALRTGVESIEFRWSIPSPS